MSEPNEKSAFKPRRIAIVGPFPPIRSGVARHTEAIANALEGRNGAEIRRWGFSRQYPGFLYPGQSERDPERKALRSEVQETLDGANPWTWYATARAIRTWKPDIVVFPAWTFAVAPALGFVAKQVSRAGIRTCMVVHNAYDHEAAGWKDQLTTWQLKAASSFVTHNQALADEVAVRFPGKSVQVFPHPVFDDVPAATGCLPRRSDLELLFFGLVRPYKGLDVLLDALQLVKKNGVSLTIAGEFWQGLEETQERIAMLNDKHSVELVATYVSDQEAAELFHRADAIVLPYRSVSGSGVVSLACHYRRAVIASDLPGFSEIVQHGKTGWLCETGDAAALAATLENLDAEQLRVAGEAAGQFGANLTWDRFTDVIIDGEESTLWKT